MPIDSWMRFILMRWGKRRNLSMPPNEVDQDQSKGKTITVAEALTMLKPYAGKPNFEVQKSIAEKVISEPGEGWGVVFWVYQTIAMLNQGGIDPLFQAIGLLGGFDVKIGGVDKRHIPFPKTAKERIIN
jgi:hypothetical protein